MALTSKQRSQLRGIAAGEDTIIQVGKGGINDALVASVNDALRARELVKGKVLENSMLTAREACDALSAACGAEQVQVIGTKFVLYKRNPKEPKIVLIKDKKKTRKLPSTAGASTRRIWGMLRRPEPWPKPCTRINF